MCCIQKSCCRRRSRLCLCRHCGGCVECRGTSVLYDPLPLWPYGRLHKIEISPPPLRGKCGRAPPFCRRRGGGACLSVIKHPRGNKHSGFTRLAVHKETTLSRCRAHCRVTRAKCQKHDTASLKLVQCSKGHRNFKTINGRQELLKHRNFRRRL